MSEKPRTVSAEQLAEQRKAAARTERVNTLRIEATKNYDLATKDLLFTKDFKTRQDAFMRDPMNTVVERVYTWILRYSWGDWSLFVIGVDGEPLYQVDCEKQIGVKKRAISAAVSYLTSRGYLEDHPKLLVPVIAPHPGKMPIPEPASKEWGAFVERWKVAHSTDFKALEDARSTVSRIRKVMRRDYKESRAQAQAAALPYSETSQSDSETTLTAAVSPFQESNLRHRQPPANPSHGGGQQSSDHAAAWTDLELETLANTMTETIRRSTQGKTYPSAGVDQARVLAKKIPGWYRTHELNPIFQAITKEQALANARRPIGMLIDLVSKAASTLAEQQASDYLFDQIESWQRRYPGSTFGTPAIDREDGGDQSLIAKIQDLIGVEMYHLVGYSMLVQSKMMGLDKEGTGLRTKSREPGTATGPKGLGILLSWAKDYARTNRSGGADG